MTSPHAQPTPPRSDPPRVDIVIPLYDKRESIGRAVHSVLAQTFHDWTLTIVDDGSTDGWTPSWADPRITVVAQDNAGPGAARNRGVGEGSAPLLAFLDADDEWEPEYLTTMVALLDSLPHAQVAAASWSGARELRHDHTAPTVWEWSVDVPPATLKDRVDALHTSATMVRRPLFETLGGFFEERATYGEDAYLWLAAAMTAPVVHTPEHLVRFHIDYSSLSAGRTTAYPIPPLVLAPDRLRSNLGPRWAQYMGRYYGFYLDLVLTRLVREGQSRTATRFLLSPTPARLGVNRITRLRLLASCTLVGVKQIIKKLVSPSTPPNRKPTT